MNTHLRKITILGMLGVISIQTHAQRFLSEVFPAVNVTTNVVYGQNYEVLTGTPVLKDLKMDVYEPAGATDPLATRPLIIYMHTGSYIPVIVNGNATGSRNDSASVEICKQLARRGYVVANMDYRLGWDPTNTSPTNGLDIRRGTLLNAVYRSIQDAKACVRYFRKDAAVNNNFFGIDVNNIFLFGQGTGGYIALNYAVLNDPSEITLPKFISSTDAPAYGIYAGMPYVNQAALGDYDGFGGVAPFNNENNPGYSSDVQFVVNLGGAMGDSSWIAAGDAPMIGIHCVDDPFAPYGVGIVYVPTTPPQSVVDVIGSGQILRWANQLGNNNCFANAGFTDPYTIRANSINNGFEGLFPLQQGINPINPQLGHAGPWEWFDLQATRNLAVAFGYQSTRGDTCYQNSLLTNPSMSKAYALAYIDTIMNYVNPRIVYCRNLPTSVKEIKTGSESLTIYNSPSKNYFTISSTHSEPMQLIEVYDIKGSLITSIKNPNAFNQRVDKNNLQLNKGVMMVKVTFNTESVTKKIIIE
jgi:hypothetical protein